MDIETLSSRDFAFCCIHSDNFNEVYFSPEEVYSFLENLISRGKNSQKIYIVGHNIEYDLSWIFGNVETFFATEKIPNGFDKRGHAQFRTVRELSMRDGVFYKALWYNLEFWDTYKLYNLSLADVAPIVGKRKGDGQEKFALMSIFETGYSWEDILYCFNDCIITMKAFIFMRNFVLSFGVRFKHTLSSNGFQIMSKMCPIISDSLEKFQTNLDLRDLDEQFIDAYFGGRTEVIRRTMNGGYCYDVNSLYPFCYITGNFPDPRNLFHVENPDLETLILKMEKMEGIAEITIKIPIGLKLGPLPVHEPDLMKKVYPVGIITGTWCFPEIRLALEMGGEILEVRNIIVGDRIKAPMENYGKYFYKLRMENKKSPLEYTAKIFMNSAYGKLCMREFENSVKLYDPFNSPPCEIIIGNDGREYYIDRTKKERSRCDIICVGAYVTSLARTHLYRLIKSINFDVYYMDTDSIFTGTKMPTGKELGELKLEYRIIKARFLGRKDYFITLDYQDKIDGWFCPVPVDYVKRKGFNLRFVPDEEKFRTELRLSRIRKSRAGLKNGGAGHAFNISKRRVLNFDSGRIWNFNESYPLYYNMI